MKVLGQYRCGCSYGPIEKKNRLKYCGIHGDDIQDEYPFLDENKNQKKERNQMTTETKDIQKRGEGPLAILRGFLANVDVKSRLEAVLGKRAEAFSNSIINVVSSNKQLKAIAQNNPSSIMRAAMKAATLNLLIEPTLGWAAIVPYGNEAVFQIMYKGVIQLCIRSGQYQTIRCTEIYADEIKLYNPITGEVTFKDPETYKMRYQEDRDEHVVGHYIYFKLLTGFEKFGYISHKEALAHAKKYSKAYQYDLNSGKGTSAWSTDPIPMGNKTVLLKELKCYGVMSIEMQDALESDRETFEEAQANATKRIQAETGSHPIDTTFEDTEPVATDAEAAERKLKVEKEKKRLRAAEKKAKDKAAKAKAPDKNKLPKYHCNACGKDFEEATQTDVKKGVQHSCLNWNTRLNEPIDPDIKEENN